MNLVLRSDSTHAWVKYNKIILHFVVPSRAMNCCVYLTWRSGLSDTNEFRWGCKDSTFCSLFWHHGVQRAFSGRSRKIWRRHCGARAQFAPPRHPGGDIYGFIVSYWWFGSSFHSEASTIKSGIAIDAIHKHCMVYSWIACVSATAPEPPSSILSRLQSCIMAICMLLIITHQCMRRPLAKASAATRWIGSDP